MKKNNFSLVELLLVVAIIAIIAGAAISTFDGTEKRTAIGQARSSITTIETAISNYRTVNKGLLPTNFDSLCTAVFTGGLGKIAKTTTLTIQGSTTELKNPNEEDIYKPGTTQGANSKGINILSKELTDYLQFAVIPEAAVKELVIAGINKLRYVDNEGHHYNTNGEELNVLFLSIDGGVTVKASSLADIENGSQIFEGPKLSDTKPALPATGGINYLGRGGTFYLGSTRYKKVDDDSASGIIASGKSTTKFAIWRPGDNWVNNIKVGAQRGDIIVALGVGENCSLINTKIASTNVNDAQTAFGLNKAPDYASKQDVTTYGRFIALFKIGEYRNPASDDIVAPATGIFSPFDDATNYIDLEENGARFIGVVDCYGNTSQELKNIFNEQN